MAKSGNYANSAFSENIDVGENKACNDELCQKLW